MEDLIFAPLVLAAAFAIHQVVLRRHQEFEQRLLNRSFAAHMVSAIALVLVYRFYYSAGDMLSYHEYGVPIADALHYDFGEVFPEVWSLFVHGDYRLPLEPSGEGSTGTMQALAVWLLFVLGNSLVASALVISVGAYLAKLLVYRSIRSEFPARLHEKVLFALMLSPTGIVWSCALLKEPVLMVFFGPAFAGLKLIQGRRVLFGALLVMLGSSVILLIKPYVLIALALAGGAWIFWARTLRSGGSIIVRPIYVLVAAAVVMLGFTTVSAFFPNLSPDRVAESMQTQRRAAAQDSGGSNFYLEGPDRPAQEQSKDSLGSQLALAPIALGTALFRPFIFESFSAMQFLNAIEMTWLTYMVIQMVRRNGVARLISRISATPALVFSVVFVLVLALGTGLSTANLGTLSRYRAPMMPFLLLLLVILREPETQETTTLTLPGPPATTAAASGIG